MRARNRPLIIAATCFGLTVVLFFGMRIALMNFIEFPIGIFVLVMIASLITGIVFCIKALKRERSPRTYAAAAVGVLILAGLILLLAGSGRFDKDLWNETARDYPVHRNGIVDDLMKNHLREGMTHGEVIELLGDSVGMWYFRYVDIQGNDRSKAIYRDYGTLPPDEGFCMAYDIPSFRGEEIYPPTSKVLIIEFTAGRTVGDFYLQEWQLIDRIHIVPGPLALPSHVGGNNAAGEVSPGEPERDSDAELPENAAAYLGKWKLTEDGGWVELTIGANKLVWLDHHGYGFTLSGLTWEAMDEPADNADYPTGYKITGRLEYCEIYALSKADDRYEAAWLGGQALNWWYINKDGQSLKMGLWIPPHETNGEPFVKQPDDSAPAATEKVREQVATKK